MDCSDYCCCYLRFERRRLHLNWNHLRWRQPFVWFSKDSCQMSFVGLGFEESHLSMTISSWSSLFDELKPVSVTWLFSKSLYLPWSPWTWMSIALTDFSGAKHLTFNCSRVCGHRDWRFAWRYEVQTASALSSFALILPPRITNLTSLFSLLIYSNWITIETRCINKLYIVLTLL